MQTRDDEPDIGTWAYWQHFSSLHDLRRGFEFATDGLRGIGVLLVDDDRSLKELQHEAAEDGLEELLATVEFVVLTGMGALQAPSSMVDVDVDDYEESDAPLYTPRMFRGLLQCIRAAKNPRGMARRIWLEGFHP